MDVFGIERKIPDASEIEAAFVNMDYPVCVSKEQIPEVLELQKQCIDSKDEYLSVYKKGKNYYYTSFRYYMKDGSVFERRYPVSVTEKALKDKNSVAFKLTALETDPDNMMKQVLGNALFIEDEKIYFESWVEEGWNGKNDCATDNYDLYYKVIVKDFSGNTLSEEVGDLYQAADGTWWIA